MSKVSRFLDAVTHSGPGYETTQSESESESRTTVERVVDAVTHKGPGYEIPKK